MCCLRKECEMEPQIETLHRNKMRLWTAARKRRLQIHLQPVRISLERQAMHCMWQERQMEQ